ncbi:MAG: hypothetical protein COT73_11505 [Bdellovibrio sp. CG10_big_fil_rev_8_21_14_0_10_47_8]|nr:MAG: hypothetical protein COT73_11505 [Bdellovibrio sp. CG10_big_fil_rev_8_21_14_0_10_47_8]
MDIKGALNAIIPPQLRIKDGVDRSIKTGTTTDRDANGQMPGDQQQPEREPMTEEQLEKAMAHLREMPAVKEHNLSVELTETNGKKFVLLTEPSGKLIRRIPEIELWTLPDFSDSEPNKKGQLLSKTA